MLSMPDTYKRFTVQLDDDSHAVLRALAWLEDVPLAVLAREAILDRLRSELEHSGDQLRAALGLIGRDVSTMHLPAPSEGSTQRETA